MDRTKTEDPLFPDCPIRNILARLCDKWSLLVIYTLDRAGRATMRFKELQRGIPDISQKMLTVTLRTLEDDGYVTRRRIRYAHGVSRSAATGGICPDGTHALAASACQRADRVGNGKQGCHHEGQEESLQEMTPARLLPAGGSLADL